MLDNSDIKKIVAAQKEAFKEDFATKKEIEYLIEIVATKKDLENFATKAGLAGVKTDIKEIAKTLSKMDGKLDDVVKLKHKVEYIENSLSIQPLKS